MHVVTHTPGPVKTYRPDARYVLLLGLLAAVPAITTDMFLPQIGDIQREFDTTTWAVQLTVTIMLIGGGVGQLVSGPLSDAFGRRKPALIGLTLHVVLSLACAMAPGIVPLIALRAAQGFFNATASVVALAVIRDRFSGSDASQLLSRLMLVIGVAPLFAPTVGSVVGGFGGWRAVFVALAVFGAVVWLAVWLRLPETLPTSRRRTGGLRMALSGYWHLLRDRQFLGFAFVPGLSFGVIMAYVVGAPFVLQEQYGFTPQQFALVFAVNGAGLVAAAQVNAALVKRFSPGRILRYATAAMVAWAGAHLVVALTGWGGLPALLVTMFFTLGFVFFLHPNATVLALERYGHMAGTAAAFMGACSVTVAGLIGPIGGLLGGEARAMATVMFGAATATLIVLAVGTPVFRNRGSTLKGTPATEPVVD